MSRRRRIVVRRDCSVAEREIAVLHSLDMSAPLTPLRKVGDQWWQTPEAWAATWGVGGER